MDKDIHNIKVAILNLYNVLERKKLLSPDEQKEGVADVIALAGVDNIKDADKKAILKDNLDFNEIAEQLKKDGRLG